MSVTGNDSNREICRIALLTHEPEKIKKEKLPLSKAAEQLLEECRMVLPGIQALFGFHAASSFGYLYRILSGGVRHP